MALVSSHLPCDACGSSDALAEYDTSTYCFSCHSHTFLKQGNSMGSQMEDVSLEPNEVKLPKGATREIPPDGMKWLWKYGITEEQIDIYGIKHCQHGSFRGYNGRVVNYHNRILLPCYDMSELKFYQARALREDDEPKYYTAGYKEYMFRSKQAETNYVILVEDILSAIKVGAVAKTVSLLGTKMNDKQVLTLLHKYDTIIVWLDSDKAGRTGSKQIKGLLDLVANSVEIKTDGDPKCYTEEEIKALVQTALEALDI